MFSADDSEYPGGLADDEGDDCRCSPDVAVKSEGINYDSPDEGLPDGSTYADYCRGIDDKRDVTAKSKSQERGAQNPYGRRLLTKDLGKKGASGQNAFASQESLTAQYVALELFPECTVVCSNFHAGPGQQTFGSSHRQRADVFLCVPSDDGYVTARYFNYHGAYWHSVTEDHVNHMPGCPQDQDSNMVWDYRGKTEDEMKARLADCLTSGAAEAGIKLRFTYRYVFHIFLSLAFRPF